MSRFFTWKRLKLPFLSCAIFLHARKPACHEDVSSGGRVESDLYLNPDNPPEALLDGNTQTHYCQHRLEDSDWRMWLSVPAFLSRVKFVQGWPDWDQATSVRLEAADGTELLLNLEPGTRDEQSFDITFQNPTAFVEVRVVSVQDDGDGSQWGGFAEIQFIGTPAGADSQPPAIEDIDVTRTGDLSADVAWRTSEPATSQARFSTTLLPAISTQPDLHLTTEHLVQIESDAPLMGYLEIRSADESGNRAEARVDAFNTLDTGFIWGVGGWSFHIDENWVSAPEVFAEDGLLVGFVQQWISAAIGTEWFASEDIRRISEGGYIPEVIHYYFGDPTIEKVLSMRDDFIEDIQYLAGLIAESGVGEVALVTLEPEFNQGGVERWEEWNDLMIEAIDILHSVAGCKVGVLAGDWDIDHLLPISMGRAAAKSDFVAFQEMRASTRNEPEDAYEVADRAIRFAHFMSRKFLRPVRWGYVMVSDYGGWTEVQRQVVVEICERQQEMQNAGVVAVSWMSYLDSPGAGGYFDEGEAHKGLKYSDNTPKPAWYIWKECTRSGPTWVQTGKWPPGGEPYVEEESGCGCAMAF